MKLIDFNEIKRIADSMDTNEWFDWVDYALIHKAAFQMPPKPRLSQADNDYYNIMPAMFEKQNIASVKMIGRHSIKHGEKRPTMMGDLMLYEADTGILKAVMDAEYITTLRTGVTAAHSALLFAKEDFDTIGLIGLGNIMTICFKTLINKLSSLYPNRTYTVKLLRHHEQEVRFMNRFKDYSNIRFECYDSYEEVIDNTDLIISAVTKATKNFCEDSYFKEGVTLIPICTLGFQNCDLFFDKVFTDEIEQIREFKYFNYFRSVHNVSDVLNNNCDGRVNDKERILVYNYGLGIHDLYFANKFFELSQTPEVEYNYCTEKYFV